MSVACDRAAAEVGNGVAAALQAVDCVTGEAIASAYGRQFAPGGALLTVLTTLLTLYVAWFGINLLLGRSSLGVRSLTPRMFLIGAILTLVTSWIAYSKMVMGLTIGGPDWIASVITGSEGSATQVFAQKIDVVFQALQNASPGQAEGKDISAFSPEGMMWLGAMLLLLGTVGVLVTARIALGVLVAVGPVFVVMALFEGTRGLFTGWLKGLVMLALVPLFAVLGGSVMLELAVPILVALVQTPGQIDPQAAMAFFVVGAVHMALMVMALKVAGTMVAGWRVFGLVPEKGERDERGPSVAPAVVPAAAAPAANDGGALGEGGRRDTRVIAGAVASAPGQVGPASTPGASRARGIGSRFRSPSPRLSEKVK